jgi:hypothetical protein
MRLVRAAAMVVALVWCSQLLSCVPDGISAEYARYSGCPEDKIAVDMNGRDGAPRASGCGNSVTFVCLGEGVRCRSPVIVVAERHAKQFSCTPREANVKDLGADAYIATGCGQTITYQCFRDQEHVVRCILESAEVSARRSE